MKVFILADTPGWIVDRITDEMIRLMPFDFIKGYYTKLSTDELLDIAARVDIVHYQNWDMEYHLPRILELRHKMLVSCRSFRFPDYFKDISSQLNVHVVNPQQLEIFPHAHYIPDGVFNFRRLRVGFAGRPDHYKGYHLIEQACKELDVDFKPALDIAPESMMSYYDSVDVVVVASENEGHNTIAMECLAINKPVISTPVGVGGSLIKDHISRDVASIKHALLKYNTMPLVAGYSWEYVCKQFEQLYGTIKKTS